MVEIEKTDASTILKFKTKDMLSIDRSYTFNNVDEASASPLIKRMFFLPFVKKVHVSLNFIAIERYNIVEWEDVQYQLVDMIEDYLKTGRDIIQKNDVIEKEPEKQFISIYIESTPNPNVMKFVANKILFQQLLEYKNMQEAEYSLLAKELFSFPYVKEVFMIENYISITKANNVEWIEINAELRSFILNFINSGKSLVSKKPQMKNGEVSNTRDSSSFSQYEKEIEKILDEYIKPAVVSDGGNIQLQSFDEATGTVYVILQGACSGCPSSTVTLKSGIEQLLKEKISQVNSVEAISA
ncbi:NifU family protein [Ichthyobacterium seriolicida]|uniref:NifU-like domain protein n=1 Tax=Ichthyobacterium seriolicida TaxID=242600 RepID=A0A1J1EBW9_9FLAO|nr:NifU N-terminal domain-containing protein [Ichthyobacterium seriolicida]BAV95008.1 NifU-like domain protein [Ichthyobacterium seriolicida]